MSDLQSNSCDIGYEMMRLMNDSAIGTASKQSMEFILHTDLAEAVMNLETPAGRKHKTCNGQHNQTQNLKAGSSCSEAQSMYAKFPGREGMRKRGCMLSGGDLDAARTIWYRNPGYGSSRRYSPILAHFLRERQRWSWNSMLLVLETKVRNPSYGLPFEVLSKSLEGLQSVVSLKSVEMLTLIRVYWVTVLANMRLVSVANYL
ncbi:hypothetical protein EDD85DRAFT_795010 [Armillaria nabsnona]|nr:hypothetical protein EDD85DRAFT_795010 [Armillaria nabsnona]